jgi:phosphoribosylformylglycinamidine synthase
VKALVYVTLKQDVLDPQGKAIAHACDSLGFDAVESVRQGKLFEVELSTPDEASARSVVDQVAEKLLANPVIEDYELVRIES